MEPSQKEKSSKRKNSKPLICSYISQYDVIYQPSYDPVFFYSAEDELEDDYEEDWDDFFPLPDSSEIGRA